MTQELKITSAQGAVAAAAGTWLAYRLCCLLVTFPVNLFRRDNRLTDCLVLRLSLTQLPTAQFNQILDQVKCGTDL